MKSVILDVEGMSCQGCVGTVAQALGNLDGVEEVSVSLEEKSASLSVQDDVDPQRLAEVVAEAGFAGTVRG